MYRDNYSSGFGGINRIRPIIMITFVYANVVVHKDITFGAGTIYQPLRSGRIWHKVNF